MTARALSRLISETGLRVLGGAAAAVGLLVLIGHTFPDSGLNRLVPGLSPVPANLALGIVLAGLSQSCLVGVASRWRWFGYILASTLCVLSALSLLEHLCPTGQDLDLIVFGASAPAGVRT